MTLHKLATRIRSRHELGDYSAGWLPHRVEVPAGYVAMAKNKIVCATSDCGQACLFTVDSSGDKS